MITVKIFADLSEQLGWSECQIDWQAGQTVHQVWQQVTDGHSIPNNLLCARNMEYCKLNTSTVDGDEVAFFPPVSGG